MAANVVADDPWVRVVYEIWYCPKGSGAWRLYTRGRGKEWALKELAVFEQRGLRACLVSMQFGMVLKDVN